MEKVCKVCGTKLSEFYKTSMLGCENCYRTFSVELNPVLKKLHGKTTHVGKTPKISAIEKEMLFEYKRLLKSKETALIEGRFQDASDLDEDISLLYRELSKRGLK